MTQSDSPNFDFDISDLEVEGSEDSPFRQGDAVSIDKATRGSAEDVGPLEVSDGEELSAAESGVGAAADEALDVFQIDDLPDASDVSKVKTAVELETVSEDGVVAADAASLEDESVSGPVSRVEDAAPPVSGRALGDVDLGADVFAEIESDSSGLGLADVIDDLMDEVEEFEAGGFVELDEETSSGEKGVDDQDFFKMEDPDDSLGRAVDPNAEEDEAESVAPAFPSPPADFEIPADPEPKTAADEPVGAQPEDQDEELREEAPAVQGPVATGSNLAERYVPADPISEMAVEEPATPALETVVSPSLEAPSDPSVVDLPEEDEVLSFASEESEFLQDDGPADSSEGHEKVFFDAEDEAAEEMKSETVSAADEGQPLEEEEYLSALIGSLDENNSTEASEPVAEPARVTEAEVPEPVEALAEADAMPTEAKTVPVPEDQRDEDEADLAALIASVEDSADGEAAEEELREEASAAEGWESAESSGESESDPEADSADQDRPAEPQSVPGLSEFSDEEEDLSALVASVSSEDGGEVEDVSEMAATDADESGEVVARAEENGEANTALTAEDLLMQAGSLLNNSKEKPADAASSLLESLDEDEEVVAMPSPEDRVAQAAELDDEEVITLPSPASMLADLAEEGASPAEAIAKEETGSGNVVDRPGDLPPPPPAPVEILDEEPPEEDFEVVERAEVAKTQEDDGPAEGETLQDPFSSEGSIGDLDETLGALDGFEDEDEDDGPDLSLSDEIDVSPEPAKGSPAPVVAEMPKPTLLWRATHSMSIAAGLVLLGSASIMGVWRQEILEYYQGRDLDGSRLIQEIETIGSHALGEFDETGRYHMQWVDSEIRRVSENEIRLYGLVGAQLKENLYKPVLESELDSNLEDSEGQLRESLEVARGHFPDEIGNAPGKPWKRLYEISARKNETLPLRVTYALTRASNAADWELSRVKVSGTKGDIVWPEGEPEYSFGDDAYDVNSLEFADVFARYQSDSREYMARIDRMRAQVEDGRLALKQENQRQRERVRLAFSEGTYFSGLAILGEDASASHDVNLVITEVRGEGAFVKGVVSIKNDEKERSKYFVGSLEFETTLTGREQGFLSLKTVSIHAPDAAVAMDAPFFESDNVSRMRLKSDGFRLEGDSRDLSFRMTRSH